MSKKHGTVKYTTQTNGFMFTVITETRVYRVRSTGYQRVRSAFKAAGIEVLKIHRDGDRS